MSKLEEKLEKSLKNRKIRKHFRQQKFPLLKAVRTRVPEAVLYRNPMKRIKVVAN